MIDLYTPEFFMKEAMKQAQIAFEEGEVPVGAVVVSNKRIIAKAHNQTEMLSDPTAHAEILAITAACNHLGAKYLQDCELYVTLEPCCMCAGAINWSQIKRIYYAAADEKKGYKQYSNRIIPPKVEIVSGLLGEQSAILLKAFFSQLRDR